MDLKVILVGDECSRAADLANERNTESLLKIADKVLDWVGQQNGSMTTHERLKIALEAAATIVCGGTFAVSTRIPGEPYHDPPKDISYSSEALADLEDIVGRIDDD